MSNPKDLSKLGDEEFKSFLDSFDTVLCDCDGVLIYLQSPIDGAAAALKNLKCIGKQVNYVTNNCSRQSKRFAEELKLMGFDCEAEQVISPTVAIIDYLKKIDFKKKLYVLSFNGMRTDFVEAGFDLADTGPCEVAENFKVIVKNLLDLDPEVGAVIFDLDFNLSFLKLQKSVFYLKNPEVLFIAAGLDGTITIGKNFNIIGPLHFQKLIKEVSGREPIEFGKPSQNLIDFVRKQLKFDAERTLFIGDTFSDMLFAHEAGFKKLLVFSGVVNKEDIEECKDSKLSPDYVLDSLGDLNELISKKVNSSL